VENLSIGVEYKTKEGHYLAGFQNGFRQPKEIAKGDEMKGSQKDRRFCRCKILLSKRPKANIFSFVKVDLKLAIVSIIDVQEARYAKGAQIARHRNPNRVVYIGEIFHPNGSVLYMKYHPPPLNPKIGSTLF